MASFRSSATRSVGRPAARPSRTRRRVVHASERAWTWRWLVTRVVSQSVDKSCCDEARIERKVSIPEPVLAEIAIIGMSTSQVSLFCTMLDVNPLLLSNETIKFKMETFLLMS